MYADLAVTIRDHCRQRGYQVSDGIRDRFDHRAWHIDVPSREGPVQLTFNGEVFLLTFPGRKLSRRNRSPTGRDGSRMPLCASS